MTCLPWCCEAQGQAADDLLAIRLLTNTGSQSLVNSALSFCKRCCAGSSGQVVAALAATAFNMAGGS